MLFTPQEKFLSDRYYKYTIDNIIYMLKILGFFNNNNNHISINNSISVWFYYFLEFFKYILLT